MARNIQLPSLVNRFAYYDAGADKGIRLYRMEADAANGRTLGHPCELKTGNPRFDAHNAVEAPDAFVAADQRLFFASVADRAAAETLFNSTEGKSTLRSLRSIAAAVLGPAAGKKVTLNGVALTLVSIDIVNNSATALPDFPDGIPLEGTDAFKRVLAAADLAVLKFPQANPPPVVAPPAPSPATGTSVVTHELKILRDTILTKSGESAFRVGYYRGVALKETETTAKRCAQNAGARDKPADFTWLNPQVTLDANWYPLAFELHDTDEAAIRGLEAGLRELFSSNLSEELVHKEQKEKKDVDSKPRYLFFRENITLVVHSAEVLAQLCRQKCAEALINKQVDCIHDHIGRLLRRINFPVQNPSSKGAVTPIWFWRAEKGPIKRQREEDFE